MAKLEALKLGAAAGRLFTFEHMTDDGPVDVSVWIRPLTAADLDRARVNAEIYVANEIEKNRAAEGSREAIIDDAREIEVLALALRDPDNHAECWAGSARLRSDLTTNEIALLFRVYHEHQDSIGPLMSSLTVERYHAMIEAIAKAGRADPFTLFDSRTQRDCITTMASELWSSRTAKSSGISGSNESGSNSSSESGSPSEPQDRSEASESDSAS